MIGGSLFLFSEVVACLGREVVRVGSAAWSGSRSEPTRRRTAAATSADRGEWKAGDSWR